MASQPQGTRDPREVIARRMCALANVSACDFNVWSDDADLIIADLAAAGFKILPRDPTDAMQRACVDGRDMYSRFSKETDTHPMTAAGLRAAWDAA